MVEFVVWQFDKNTVTVSNSWLGSDTRLSNEMALYWWTYLFKSLLLPKLVIFFTAIEHIKTKFGEYNVLCSFQHYPPM